MKVLNQATKNNETIDAELINGIFLEIRAYGLRHVASKVAPFYTK